MPTETQLQESSLLNSLKQLFRLLPTRQRRMVGWMLVLQIIAAGSEILSLGAVIPFLGALANAPQLMGQAAIQPWLQLLNIQTPKELVVTMAILFSAAIVLSNALRLLTIRMQYRFSAEIGNFISAEVYRRTLYQPYSFHTQHSSSEIIALSTLDASNVSGGLIPATFYFVTNSLVVFAIAITLVVFDPLVALWAAVIVGGAYGLIIIKTRKLLRLNGQRISELSTQSVKAIQEGLGGIRDVLIDGAQPIFESIYREANRAMLNAQGLNNFTAMAPRFLVEPIAIISIVTLAVGMAYNSNQLTGLLPLLGVLALGANRLLPALQQCFSSLAGISDAVTVHAIVNLLISIYVLITHQWSYW